MIAILKALEALSEKLTDSAIAVLGLQTSIKTTCRRSSHQNERNSCKIWGKLVAITEINTENVVHLIWVTGHAGAEGNEWADKMAKEGGRRSQS